MKKFLALLLTCTLLLSGCHVDSPQTEEETTSTEAEVSEPQPYPITINDVEIENGTIEVGYVVHPDYWGRGHATAALKLAIRELFAKGYREITAGAFHQNPASLRVMEKAGMTKIDKTDEIQYRGKTHRCIYYSIQK